MPHLAKQTRTTHEPHGWTKQAWRCYIGLWEIVRGIFHYFLTFFRLTINPKKKDSCRPQLHTPGNIGWSDHSTWLNGSNLQCFCPGPRDKTVLHINCSELRPADQEWCGPCQKTSLSGTATFETACVAAPWFSIHNEWSIQITAVINAKIRKLLADKAIAKVKL